MSETIYIRFNAAAFFFLAAKCSTANEQHFRTHALFIPNRFVPHSFRQAETRVIAAAENNVFFLQEIFISSEMYIPFVILLLFFFVYFRSLFVRSRKLLCVHQTRISLVERITNTNIYLRESGVCGDGVRTLFVLANGCRHTNHKLTTNSSAQPQDEHNEAQMPATRRQWVILFISFRLPIGSCFCAAFVQYFWF